MADRRGYRTFGVLDIGTAKTVAGVVVAEYGASRGEPSLRLAGVGLQRSKGMKAGVLTDLDEAESVVRAVIGQAERAAGVSVSGVTASVSCGRLSSQHFTARAEVESGYVSDDDVSRLMQAAEGYAERDGRSLIHMNRLGCELDGAPGAREPRGLSARQLAAYIHAVTADEAPLRNLLVLLERSYTQCDGLVAAPYASALAVTTEEERQFGVTVIDIGAGTTDIALFAEGLFIGADVIPVGGQHVTYDIAKALQTPLPEAERIKTLYGTLINAQSDEHEAFSVPVAGDDGDDEAYEMTKARLTDIIRPRVSQILALVRERLAMSSVGGMAGDKIVLSGGASQLLGLREFVANELNRPVRLGRPSDVAGLSASLSGPQLSVLSGLSMIAARGTDQLAAPQARQSLGQGYLGRVSNWLKRGF